MCNVTHILLVIGKNVLGLPFTILAMSLTFCWSYKRSNETAFHKMCNVAHRLLIIIERCYAEMAFCNVTHFLLVIGKDVM